VTLDAFERHAVETDGNVAGNGYPSAREVIEAVTERTAWALNNSNDIEMAQGLSADIKTKDD